MGAYKGINKSEGITEMDGFKMVAVQEVTITGPVKFKGSNRVAFNYDLDGKPFGQVFTYKAKNEIHPYHVALATGEHIGAYRTKEIADKAIRGMM
jgi:hypothetical protein